MTKVMVADDEPLLRAGLRMILEAEQDITVVAEAADGAEAVEEALRSHPDVVLMDVRMPRLDGIEATRRLVAAGSRARVLAITTFDLDEYAFKALQAGASGFLLKATPPAQLTHAVRTVAAGASLLDPGVTHRLIEHFLEQAVADDDSRRRLDELTPRESEVLLLLARGLSNAEMARALFLTEATVKSHVTALLSKLGVRSRVQAVVFAYETGLVQPGVRRERV